MIEAYGDQIQRENYPDGARPQMTEEYGKVNLIVAAHYKPQIGRFGEFIRRHLLKGQGDEKSQQAKQKTEPEKKFNVANHCCRGSAENPSQGAVRAVFPHIGAAFKGV